MARNKPIQVLGDLTPDPENARRHTPRNMEMIEAALQEVGAARSIVIDEDGLVLAGNATIEAAVKAGIERVQVVDADGSTIIAVRRSGLSKKDKKRLALYDNQAGALAEWDSEQIAALQREEAGALAGIFDADELAEILQSVPNVEFPEYTEDIENDVKMCECPECGHKFPA